MSAKKTKKRSGKNAVKWVVIVIEVIILAAALLVWWALDYDSDPTEPTAAEGSITQETADTVPQVTVPEPIVEEIADTEYYLSNGLKILNVGSYTGAYLEDGSNEIVSDVLMLVVANIGQDAVQYAEIRLPTDNGEAKFSLSTLPAGESAVLLELNRMEYTGSEDASQAVADNVAVFSEPLSLCEDLLELQILDGAVNVTNISGQDITGDIVVYYKNAATDLYYGGITYRARIEGGMKVDEIRQIIASHFSDTGSKVMFITVG